MSTGLSGAIAWPTPLNIFLENARRGPSGPDAPLFPP